MGYYAFGFKPETTFPAFYNDYYGDIEGPRTIALLCAPLITIFAACGLAALLPRRTWFSTPALLLAGNSLGPLYMLGLAFMSVRYTFDCWGTLLIAAALGLRAAARWLPGPGRLAGSAVLACLAIGILGSHLTLLRYKINYSGTDPAVRYALSARLQPLLCPAAPLARGVKLDDFNPLVTPNCPPLW
jgi:hypothetical protein